MRKILCSLILLSLLILGAAFVLPDTALAQGSVDPNAVGGSMSNGAPTPQPTDSSIAGWIWTKFKQMIGTLLVTLGGAILYFAGTILNVTFNYTLVTMSAWVSQMTVINDIWSVFRDMANLMFIFILIWLAIRLIVGLGGNTTKSLAVIIACALLINFSLFFTKLAIDVSNTVAFQFYTSIDGDARNQAALIDPNAGLSWAFVKAMGLVTVFKTSVTVSDALGQNSVDASSDPTLVSIFMAFIFMLVAAFVFFVAAIMLIIRFVILIFLMATSPIFVAGMALPQLKKYASQWLDNLVQQCLFAPFLMIGLWAVYKIVTNGKFQEQLGGRGFADAFNGSQQNVVVFINFLVIITLLLMVLGAARSLGGHGAEFATKWGGKLAFGSVASLGRNTVGRAASRAARSEGFQRWAGRSWIGEQALKGTRGAANANYDFRASNLAGTLGQISKVNLGAPVDVEGFEGRLETQKKDKLEFGKSLDKKGKDAYIARTASGPLTRGGSERSPNSLFGAMGRHNRLAAAQLLNDRIKEVNTERNQAINELAQLRRNPRPTPAEVDRALELAGSIRDLQREKAALGAQQTALQLKNTQKQQY